MVSTNTDVVLLHPGQFNMLNPKMEVWFRWFSFSIASFILMSHVNFRAVSGLLVLFFLMSKMKLTVLKFLSCIDPTPRRNKHSWLEVMTSTREPINTALDFFICQSHLKHVCSGQVLVNVYIYIFIFIFIYILSRHRVVWAVWAYFFGNEKMDNIRSRH